MSQKKDDLPAMPFYVGDWLKAPDIQCLDHELKGIWFDMLCYMWESKERGVLLYSREELSRLLRLPLDLLEQKLKQMESKSIFSVREIDGAIYNRRMVRDQEIREIRTKAGSLGGRRSFASRFAQAKVQAKCETETESENEVEDGKKERVPRGRKVFIAPTLQQVVDYCQERNSTVDPHMFHSKGESNGWVDKNGNKYKDWKAVIRTWEGFDKKRNTLPTGLDLYTDAQKRTLAKLKESTLREFDDATDNV